MRKDRQHSETPLLTQYLAMTESADIYLSSGTDTAGEQSFEVKFLSEDWAKAFCDWLRSNIPGSMSASPRSISTPEGSFFLVTITQTQLAFVFRSEECTLQSFSVLAQKQTDDYLLTLLNCLTITQVDQLINQSYQTEKGLFLRQYRYISSTDIDCKFCPDTVLLALLKRENTNGLEAILKKASPRCCLNFFLYYYSSKTRHIENWTHRLTLAQHKAIIHHCFLLHFTSDIIAQHSKSVTPECWLDLTYLLLKTNDAKTLQLCFEKYPATYLNAQLGMGLPRGDTLLHQLFKKGTATTLKIVISKLSSDALRNALWRRDARKVLPWQWLVLRNLTEVMPALLNKLSSYDVKYLLTLNPDNYQILNWLTAMILFEQNKTILTEWWLLVARLVLETNAQFLRPILEKTQAHLMAVTDKTGALLNITLSDGSGFNLFESINHQQIEAIKAIGLKSWTDYWLLKQWNHQHLEQKELSMVLSILKALNSLKYPSDIPEHVLKIYQAMSEGCLSVKIFSGWIPHAWPGFIDSLATPTKRPALRDPRNKGPVKYFFSERRVGEYASGHGPQNRHERHQKKQATTVISPEAITPLFQMQHPDTLLVGVAILLHSDMDDNVYDENKAKPVVLFLKDSGTFGRQWCGSKENVEKYAKQIRHVDTLEEFIKLIRYQIGHTNEALVEPSARSLLSIVVARDTTEALELAKKYQTDVEDELGILLPITLYFPNEGRLIADLAWYERCQRGLAVQKVIPLTKCDEIMNKYWPERSFLRMFSRLPDEIRALKFLFSCFKKKGKTQVDQQTIEDHLISTTSYSRIDRIALPRLFCMPGITAQPPQTTDGSYKHKTDRLLLELWNALAEAAQGSPSRAESDSAAHLPRACA